MADCWAATMVVKKDDLTDVGRVPSRGLERLEMSARSWVDLMGG